MGQLLVLIKKRNPFRPPIFTIFYDFDLARKERLETMSYGKKLMFIILNGCGWMML